MLSLNTPVAVKDNFVPGIIVRPDGLMEMDTRVAFETSSVVDALMESSVAVMVVVPGPTALARPLPLILATPVLDEVQETFPVTL